MRQAKPTRLSFTLLHPRRRRLPLAMRKRLRRLEKIGLALALSMLLGVLAIWASYWQGLRIQTVAFVPQDPREKQLLTATVYRAIRQDAFRLFSPESIFFVPRQHIRDALEAFPWVQEARVRVVFSKRLLQLHLREREPEALWCRSAARKLCFWVDATGMRFYPAAADELAGTDLPLLLGGHLDAAEPFLGSYVYPAARIMLLKEVLRAIADVGMRPKYTLLQDHRDVRVYLQDGPELLIRLSQAEPATLARRLRTLQEHPALANRWEALAYVDLRFGTRIFYKFKNKEDAQGTNQETLREFGNKPQEE